MIISNNNYFIEELQQQINIIETKLEQLRVFYITYNGKYDYERAEIFLKNLQDFIEKEYIKDVAYLQARFGDEVYFIRYYTNFNRNIMNKYLEYSKYTNPNNNTPEVVKSNKQEADILFNIICDEKEDKLFIKMLLLKQKLRHIEHIKKKNYLINSCIMITIGIVITTIIILKFYHYIN
jgi:thiamine kinase-like enzyme